jgi:hypothetical protein
MPQRRAVNNNEISEVPPIVHEVLRSPGQPLDPTTRAYFEPRFGHDFSQVRVHTDARAAESAQAVNALAYTVESDVVFGSHQYAPNNSTGRELLAHELTHTLQTSLSQKMGKSEIIATASEGAAEVEAERTARAVVSGQPIPTISGERSHLFMQKAKPIKKAKTDPVMLIKINITAGKVTFVTATGIIYQGTVTTDLAPGNYKLIPKIEEKKWMIPGTPLGLRFCVDLEEADPWALSYTKELRMEVVQGGMAELPISETLGLKDTEPIKGDPKTHPSYVQNAIKGVGIFGWGGPFRLDRKIVEGMGVDSIYLPRNEVSLDKDPLKDIAGALNVVYKSRAAAEKTLSAIGISGFYTFYIGPGGHIYPTVISDTTAPALCGALRKAVEIERTNAKAAEKLSIDLLLWYVGARFPVKAGEPSPAGGAAKPPQGTYTPRAAVGGGSAVGTVATVGGERALVFVEIGAGDLRASIELAKKGGVKVIAVDPVAPAASAIKEFEAVGGTFIKGTAKSLTPSTADHVFQYLPWKITGTGGRLSIEGTGTWSLIEDTVKLLKPNGAAHFVTEEFKTAEFLAGEASKRGLKAVITETTAGAAAPGASGAGVPGFSKTMRVWLVNIYK